MKIVAFVNATLNHPVPEPERLSIKSKMELDHPNVIVSVNGPLSGYEVHLQVQSDQGLSSGQLSSMREGFLDMVKRHDIQRSSFTDLGKDIKYEFEDVG